MLKNIPITISPELLKLLSQMGDGDELLLCGANYPAYGMGIKDVIHVHCPIEKLLADILTLMPLSDSVIPATMYFEEDENSPIAAAYTSIIAASDETEKLDHIDRLDKYPFLNRAEKVFCAAICDDTAPQCEIILTKGRVERA